MNKNLLFHAIILLISFNVNGQTGLLGISDPGIIAGSGERIRLFTDRSLYCVNENIFFSAGYSCGSEVDSITWSRVLYVELMKWNGVKIAHLKLKLDKSGASGSLRIPEDLLSGNYYLRAYTKWMRNFSVYDYEYRLIKIINPFDGGIDAGPADVPDSPGSTVNPSRSKKRIQEVHCSINKSWFQPREKAEVEITLEVDTVLCHDYCISVVKTGTIDTSYRCPNFAAQTSGIKEEQIEFLPEIQGITISGKVLDKTLNTPKNKFLVSLSEPANGEFFSVYQTRNKGRFIFSLPDMVGKYDFFIQSEVSDTGLSEFLIDNDFCNRPVLLTYVEFNLNDQEKHLIQEIIVNMQLNEKFFSLPDTTKNRQAHLHQPVSFYGSRKHTYYTQKYIELPNVEEFFNEIVLEAKAVSDQGKHQLKITGSTGFSNYPALVLLDNIQVHNDDRLLKLPLDKIERVDAIESGYNVANMKFSGLLSIYSKNRDFAGIELNKNGMFFAFNGFSSENSPCNFPGNPSDKRVPFRPNLLYWNPDIRLFPGKKTTISFYTSDNKGDYMVYVFGKNGRNDSEIYGICSFSIK